MGKNLAASNNTFFFCDGGSCQKAGGENVVRAARAYLRNNGLWNTTHTIKTKCNGRCEDAPTCIVQSGNYWYKDLDAEKIKKILEAHIYHQKGVTPYLMYKDKWGEVVSDNERKNMKPKGFEFKNDVDLGACCIAKGFSSDQYLYPLFLYLLQVKKGISLQLSNGELYDFENLEEVKYDAPYVMSLVFKNNKKVNLVIGFVPKSESVELVQQKISVTEYFRLESTGNKGIRFKNKVGETVAIIRLNKQMTEIWEYCLTIQLNGMLEPKNNTINV